MSTTMITRDAHYDICNHSTGNDIIKLKNDLCVSPGLLFSIFYLCVMI